MVEPYKVDVIQVLVVEQVVVTVVEVVVVEVIEPAAVVVVVIVPEFVKYLLGDPKILTLEAVVLPVVICQGGGYGNCHHNA